MAAGKQLRLKFGTMNGEKTWTFRNIKDGLTTQEVNTAMDAMITNGSVYQNVPLTKVSAILSITEETEFDVSQ